MSVLHLPRLHFRGLCRVHAPTGASNRGGNIDLTTNSVVLDNRVYSPDAPAEAFQRRLKQDGVRYDAAGKPAVDGAFTLAAGWNLAGNGHCSWEAVTVVGIQTRFGKVETDPAVDPMIGTAMDLWGHYNEYLGTTFNRARWVELDPTSRWTDQVLAGQLTIGRRGSSIDAPALLSGGVTGAQAARWQKSAHIRDLPDSIWSPDFARAELFQFVIRKDDPEFYLASNTLASPILSAFASALDDDDVDGLVIQYVLSNMSAPIAPNQPVFYDLVGTVGIWRGGEMATYPAGRLLVPADAARAQGLGNFAAQIADGWLSLNLPLAFGRRGRAPAAGPNGPSHAVGPVDDLGAITILVDDHVIATVSADQYRAGVDDARCGIVDVALAGSIPPGPLSVIAERGNRALFYGEQEWVVQSDHATLTLDMPDRERGEDYPAAIEVRSFHRGQARSRDGIRIRPFWNPAALPLTLAQQEEQPGNAAISLVDIEIDADRPSDGAASLLTFATDGEGRARLNVRARKPGSVRLWFDIGDGAATPLLPEGMLGEAAYNYDNQDRLGFWSSQGTVYVRVLPDDWQFDSVPDEAVDYAFLYHHVLAYYELVYPFMRSFVFSLADECKCETYARLMWQMCDHRNRDKTYYMPPMRDLSLPKSRLFLKYLRNVEPIGIIPPCL